MHKQQQQQQNQEGEKKRTKQNKGWNTGASREQAHQKAVNKHQEIILICGKL